MDSHEERFRAFVEKDFAPDKQSASADARAAAALEYLAYQSGQVNRKLDRLIEAVERLNVEDVVGALG